MSSVVRKRRRRRVYAFRPFYVTCVRCGGDEPRPRPRSGHRVACSTANLYALGGYNPEPEPEQPDDPTWSVDRPIFRDLWSFNLTKARWRRLAGDETLPAQLASSALCLAGGTLLLFGGTGAPFGRQCSNELHAYRLRDEDAFRLVETTGRTPPPQYGQAIIVDEGYLYTIGGTDGLLYTIDIHRLDFKTSLWETVFTCNGNRADEPEARYRHELAFDGSKLYILAGGTAERAFDFVDVPVFDLAARTWDFLKSLPDASGRGRPSARKCHSAVQVADDDGRGIRVFVMGGFDNNRIFDDLWRLEIPSLQWTLMRKSVFPHPLYFHSSAVTPEGCMYTFGGIQLNKGSRSTSRSDKLYKLWLRIPKLSEICWESMLYYFPHMVDADGGRLLKCGVPQRFVERLSS